MIILAEFNCINNVNSNKFDSFFYFSSQSICHFIAVLMTTILEHHDISTRLPINTVAGH